MDYQTKQKLSKAIVELDDAIRYADGLGDFIGHCVSSFFSVVFDSPISKSSKSSEVSDSGIVEEE